MRWTQINYLCFFKSTVATLGGSAEEEEEKEEEDKECDWFRIKWKSFVFLESTETAASAVKRRPASVDYIISWFHLHSQPVAGVAVEAVEAAVEAEGVLLVVALVVAIHLLPPSKKAVLRWLSLDWRPLGVQVYQEVNWLAGKWVKKQFVEGYRKLDRRLITDKWF